MKKILMLSAYSSPSIGGVESFIDHLTTVHSKHGLKTILITYGASKRTTKKNNVRILYVKRTTKKSNPGFIPLFFAGLWQNFDFIHAHGSTGIIAGYFLSKIKNRPSSQ